MKNLGRVVTQQVADLLLGRLAQRRIHRAVALRGRRVVGSVDRERDVGEFRVHRARRHPHVLELDAVVGGGGPLVVDQGDDILVEDVLLGVGERLEADESLLKGVVAHLDAETTRSTSDDLGADGEAVAAATDFHQTLITLETLTGQPLTGERQSLYPTEAINDFRSDLRLPTLGSIDDEGSLSPQDESQ